MRLLASVYLVLVLLWPPSPAVAAPGFELTPPVGGRVERGFDDVGRFEAGHRGVDLSGSSGEVVRAGAEGRVHFAGWVAGRGTVSIDHGNGWRTTYQPVRPAVSEGDVVEGGTAIGRLLPGHCAAPCLHWGLTDGTIHANPLAYLERPPVRLLPAGTEPQAWPELPPATTAMGGELPVAGRVTSPFGMRVHPVTGVFKLHDGVDLAAPCGTPIGSFAAGTVTRADFNVGYGFRVIVDHGGGFRTAYTHMPRLEVRAGDRVAGGQRVGAVGNTGFSTGCHLHWMAWRDGRLIDPLKLVGGRS